jgi:hypothetical protein
MSVKVVPIIVTLIVATPSMASSVYHLSPQGNDARDGKSTATAWQTTKKVNASHFGPGDSLLIDGGHGAFSGCLTFYPSNVTSTSNQKFVVGVYNGTKWTLNSNCGSDGILQAAITIDGVSGIVVQDGILSGNGTHTLVGIWIRNTVLAGPADTVIVQRMDISDFNTTLTTTNSEEVFITGWPGNGLTNIQILNNKLHGASVTSLDDNGIWGYGNGQNITATYSGNEVYYMGGLTGRALGTTGAGITCNGTKSCEVANNYIHDIGANVNQCGGAGGIETYNADSSYVHHNEVHHIHASTWTSGTCDFSALDADGFSTNGLWERNYTHHNDGPAINFGGSPPAEPWGPNTFRLNVSEEDNLQGTDGGGIWALGPTSNGYVYNNTAYRSLNVSAAFPFCVSLGYNGTYGGGLIANNTCTNLVTLWGGYSGGLSDDTSGYNQSALKILNNNYQLAGTPLFYWQGYSYTSLGGFQATTGKDVNSIAVNPLFRSPGGGGDCGGVLNGTCPSAYKLSYGSPMVGRGTNISAFGITPPSTGYYGTPFQNAKGDNIGIDSSIPSRTARPSTAAPPNPNPRN